MKSSMSVPAIAALGGGGTVLAGVAPDQLAAGVGFGFAGFALFTLLAMIVANLERR